MGSLLRLRADHFTSPIGDIVIVADDEGRLRWLGWPRRETGLEERLAQLSGVRQVVLAREPDPAGLSTALRAYFAGDLQVIDTIPVETGGTVFQRLVWQALRDIPCGETISYGTLARRIGRPAAVRAVGLANGANPVAVVVPCHRVIGSNGTLTGYGGGLENKSWLLTHEGNLPAASPQLSLLG